MANKRVLIKTDDGEWQFWADIVWLNCLVVYISMGVYIATRMLFNETRQYNIHIFHETIFLK